MEGSGREAEKGGDICIYTVDSLHPTTETDTAF